MGTNYYLRPEACETCGRSDDEVHVGKQSGGWAFAWRVYDEGTGKPTAVAGWAGYLRRRIAAGDLFVDEYGRQVESLDDWLDARRALAAKYAGTSYRQRAYDGEFC